MIPSPAPRYYLVGAILAAAGAVVLLLRALQGRARAPGPRSLFVVGIATLAVGVTVAGAGLWLDADYNARMNATSFSYTVSLAMNGTGPVQVSLPAPSDARFFDALNVSNGSSSLRLNASGADTNVVLTAYGNVSFDVHVQVATPPTNWSVTRIGLCTDGADGLVCNATIQMTAPLSGSKALLTLRISIGTVCSSTGLEMESWIAAGVAGYPARRFGIVC